uniref:aldehyde dehydrogenase, cytosolic 1-like n=1 Tax=Ciona intestinalis TaxID=7719 RepID=UPI000180C51B|nr:aldehyde dehydrogenase, cytosolic 1-like [Ciona intestinalis]|eukprot:XP_002127803.1 aldehyde dehydrogenase, cytosolic 1-like [Ciona intestinalis]
MAAFPPPIKNPEIKYTKLFINNEFVDAKDGSTFPTENPATGEEICQVSEAKAADVDAAVAAARKAFQPGSEWRKMEPKKRGVLLNKLADLMERDYQYLASLESLDGGKVYTQTCGLDIRISIDGLRYFAGWADKDHGKTMPMENGYFAYTRHEPIGVCGAIIPWNVPLVMFCWKLGPCVSMGNVLVLKPAELTPLTALYMASLIKEAGFPPGVVNVIPGFGKTAGSPLSRHMDVDKIAFTGSTLVGRQIQKDSAETNLKRVTLELGGKSPNIVFADADMDYAVKMAHDSVFMNAGQICCAGTRTFVHEDIYDEFVKRSVERAKQGRIGEPSDLEVEHGPQITKLQKDKILKYLEGGVKQGCKIECGGGEVKGKGHFVQPTVLTNLTDDMTVSKEEIFGPVQQIYKFKDVSEVLKRANNTKYGLAAAVFTNDINKAMAISNGVEAGTVWVNCYFKMEPSYPFGGYKESGIGREQGEYVLHEYTEVKTVVMKIDPTK